MNFLDSLGERTREGRIEAISGGMFSGKSEELVRRLRRAAIARQSVQVFTPSADTRQGPQRLVTRDKRELEAVSVSSSGELRRMVRPGVEVVGIDEAQFFDDGLVELVTELADAGVRVIVAGLDLDYLRRPFGPMPRLLAIAACAAAPPPTTASASPAAASSSRWATPSPTRPAVAAATRRSSPDAGSATTTAEVCAVRAAAAVSPPWRR